MGPVCGSLQFLVWAAALLFANRPCGLQQNRVTGAGNGNLVIHNCDLCHSKDFTSLEVARPYIGDNEPPVVCMGCGFVYVRNRRSSEEVAKSWDDIWGEGYTSEWPAVKARLFYVAEWLDQTIGLKGKSLLEIGAGEGTFLEMVRDRGILEIVGIEPSKKNVERIRDKNLWCYEGTVETCKLKEKFDIVCLLWTLENCADCIGMLKRARKWLKPDGYLVVATGSRIQVPFKKALSAYFSKNPADMHCFRFSSATLHMAMVLAGVMERQCNNYLDSDCLVLIGQRDNEIPKQDYSPATCYTKEVLDFFQSWSEQFP